MVRAVVTEGYLRATRTPEPADAFLIAVPTPFLANGGGHEPDLSYVAAASRSIAPVLKPGDLVVLESTSPVGTTARMAAWLAELRPDLSFPQTLGEASDIRIAHCPERVLPGHVLSELVQNDRVIGGMTPRCSARAVELYRLVVQGACIVTTPETAEMAKLTENSFRDVNIAFANELSIICAELGIDVWELIALANRHPRVSSCSPARGWAGTASPSTPGSSSAAAPRRRGSSAPPARSTTPSRPGCSPASSRRWPTSSPRNPGRHPSDVTVACWGLAFKPDIDDLRGSPALDIARDLCDRHPGPVLVVEPHLRALPPSLAARPAGGHGRGAGAGRPACAPGGACGLPRLGSATGRRPDGRVRGAAAGMKATGTSGSEKAQADQLERQEGAAAELEAVRTRVRDLEAEVERANERARGDAQVIQSLQERLELVEDSTSFRLGHALVLGAKSPRRLAGLPAAAWRLWREARSGGIRGTSAPVPA